MMEIVEQQLDEERALYGSQGLRVVRCRFEGSADGESACKECRDLTVQDSFFDLRYPFWHDTDLTLHGCEMTENCRAALWYSNRVAIADSRLHGIKALRECEQVSMQGCHIVSAEFGWRNRGVRMQDVDATGEYFMFQSRDLDYTNVKLNGKYSFQYIEDARFRHCHFTTKDAFWHAKRVRVEDSVIRGEYLGWYCEDVTFVNCTLIGTQPLCYCKGLTLIDCRLEQADLCLEKSRVQATLLNAPVSIKNPRSGHIRLPRGCEWILDDPLAKATIEEI